MIEWSLFGSALLPCLSESSALNEAASSIEAGEGGASPPERSLAAIEDDEWEFIVETQI